jgi:hypothetical protein
MISLSVFLMDKGYNKTIALAIEEKYFKKTTKEFISEMSSASNGSNNNIEELIKEFEMLWIDEAIVYFENQMRLRQIQLSENKK